MKQNENTITYNGKEYLFVFNLNVMQALQEEYGTIDKWASVTDGANGEPNAKAVIFGFREMLNEGIDITNERRGQNEPFLTLKQVGRMITEIGLLEATKELNKTVVESTEPTEKNA